MPIIKKNCPQCQKEFTSLLFRNQKYCSLICRNSKYLKPKKEIKCKQCKKIFLHGAKTKFCSERCRKDHSNKLFKTKNTKLDVCSATIGAIGELRVSVDLLIKGYDVYRALSPAAASDLAIIYENKIYRVEVTTGYLDYKGNLINNKKYADNSKFDIVAVVLKSGEITYFPSLKEIDNAEQNSQ